MSQKINTKEKNKNENVPQFPFKRWQITFHLSFVIMIAIVATINYQIYISQHIQQLKPSLSQSFLSDLINQYPQQNKLIQSQANQSSFLGRSSTSLYRYNNDPQWQAYRKNFPILIILALIWRFITYLAYLIDTFVINRNSHQNKSLNHFSYVNKYIFVFSFILLIYSFRADFVFYISIIAAWFLYVKICLKLKLNQKQMLFLKNVTQKTLNKIIILSFWLIMLTTLYLNERYGHFMFLSEWFQTNLIPDIFQPLKNSYRAIHCSQLLNMTFLRLLSYGIDRVKERDEEYQLKQKQMLNKKLVICSQDCQVITNQNDQQQVILYCEKGRDHIQYGKHSVRTYFNYVLFTPIMLTGPPISYLNYMSFGSLPSPGLSLGQILHYFMLVISFEAYQHIYPTIQPTKQMSLIQMQLFSLMGLVFIWYKFLIIWKTAKIWSQFYCVITVDNMSRCVFNNYGFQGFWRMWHRGFNHWLVRYLYVPLGGRNNLLSILATVAFVAFWHDHTFNIVFWALIISLLMIPQIITKRYFRSHYKHLYKTYWFKYLSSFVAAIYIYFLMISNLIGFGYGADKMEIVINKIFDSIPQLIFSLFIVISAVNLMFYKRNMENNKLNY